MISHISGTLENIDQNSLTIDVGGIGYKVFAPATVLASIPPVGEKIKIYTEQIVREDSITLYGFKTKEEKNLFNSLLNVSGIGPKMAMSIISGLPLDKLVSAISQGNSALLSSVPGIGNKTAQRIIIELKEKIGKAYALESSGGPKGALGEDNIISDAISALMTLGYSPKEARDSILKIDTEKTGAKTVEDIIKVALKNLV